MNEAANILNTAADYIEEHGWCRSEFSKRGRVCLAGAMSVAVFGTPHLGGAVFLVGSGRAALEALRNVTGAEQLGKWNDKQKSRRPVIAALREAAKVAK